MMIKINEHLILLFLVAVGVGIDASRLGLHLGRNSTEQQTLTTTSSNLLEQGNISPTEKVLSQSFAVFAAAQTCAKHKFLHCEGAADNTHKAFLDPNAQCWGPNGTLTQSQMYTKLETYPKFATLFEESKQLLQGDMMKYSSLFMIAKIGEQIQFLVVFDKGMAAKIYSAQLWTNQVKHHHLDGAGTSGSSGEVTILRTGFKGDSIEIQKPIKGTDFEPYYDVLLKVRSAAQ
eukprot:TRINITY_DN32700_c0_g1_i2.p2 TRINITY_DN32700_c0_g1~~TRINITY_DN32700_c0_g1_i2.p2  ORF type:complete len:232 (+),score=13.32 TRINITY_DN32700_c0_g1_i2:19-714(+)